MNRVHKAQKCMCLPKGRDTHTECSNLCTLCELRAYFVRTLCAGAIGHSACFETPDRTLSHAERFYCYVGEIHCWNHRFCAITGIPGGDRTLSVAHVVSVSGCQFFRRLVPPCAVIRR